MKINRERVQRLWREEGLRNPPQKRRKRSGGHSGNSCAMKKAEHKNHVDGRRLKWFSVMDEFTRECLALEVERRMTARDVVAILTWLEAGMEGQERFVPITGQSSSREPCGGGWRRGRSGRCILHQAVRGKTATANRSTAG
jgi:hypothetical protein